MKYVIHRNIKIPMLGFGTWHIGDEPDKKRSEIETIQYGIDKLGMTLIDTAEMYGEGKSELVIQEILAKNDRGKIFLIDKIYPFNADEEHFDRSLRQSLDRLNTTYIDLYLLHWRENADIQVVVDKMENAKAKGLIRQWGVSNFDVKDMEDLFKCSGGENCFANQILYNISERGVEFDLLKWNEAHDVLNIIYSPLACNYDMRQAIFNNPEISYLCRKRGVSIEALMLSFVCREGKNVAVFKTSSIEHLLQNTCGCFDIWSEEELKILENVYEHPGCKVALAKI